ncbi:plasmid mobilization relaxosome protein MobC [Flavobacterium sp. Sd200]|uniref:plasmid mobilization protein n=1 Tax=Flavobacterium sp. Sd200 TaxID=2692211 RepID=UPI00136BD76B|nr:plasmid mobilization relaxosome protein MobC [Flavobacterium sp. Sd200]MXN91688.1 plasmid mobilization relaxosome protein MobC [Flavobacterium sp. Sd200]
MMMEPKDNAQRSHWLHLRLRAEEHEKLMRKFKATTCRKVSEYVRNCLFEKPITMLHRNASLDQGLQELSLLREELRAIGQNLNQVTYRVNANPAVTQDKGWQSAFLSARSSLVIQMEALSGAITKLSTLWLQS